MDLFQQIYSQRADWYARMVAREDQPGALLPAVLAVCPLDGARVVEFGAGTGRVTRLVASRARRVHAFDGSLHMLQWSARTKPSNVTLAVADNRSLPVRSGWADVAIEGWSFSHMTDWHPVSWRDEAGKAFDEMLRVLRPGGMAVVIESLGTGYETPTPPSPVLAEYYDWLERDRGFTRTWCRTDFLFESLEEAVSLARPFFGEAIADRIAREKLVALPECTGVWWRKL
jgi:ubiquinone/menaquinone biosynthesis C-methylase UbiE